MAKIVKIIFFLFASFSLLLGAYEKQLADFDNNFIHSNEKIKYHHQLKNFYIQSVINEDEKTKIEVLKRLIISSRVLNLDDKSYEEELKTFGLSKNELEALKNKFNTAKQSTQENKIPKNENTPKLVQEKNSNKQNEPKLADTNTNKTLFVLSSTQLKNGVSLKLSQVLNQKELKISELKEKDKYRYILDFTASLEGGKKEFHFDDKTRITLAQYDPKTTRLVLHSKEELQNKIDIEDKNLKFSFTSSQAQKAKEQKAKVQNEQPKQAQAKSMNNSPKQEQKLYVLKSNALKNGIELSLNQDLKTEPKVFMFKDKDIFRYVYNIEAVLEGSKKNFYFGKNFITISQYSPKIVRIVLNSTKELKPFAEAEGKKLILAFSSSNETEKISSNPTKNEPKSTQSSKNTASKQSTVVSKKTPSLAFKKSKIVVIDPGHGGKDAGAVNGKLYEKNIVLDTALKLGNELKKRGYQVFYTRSKDVFINLRDRTKIANEKKGNLFISIHANAAPNATKAQSMQGVETFFLSPARSARSSQVAAAENKSDVEEMNFFGKQSTIFHSLSRDKIIASNKLAIDVQKGLLSSLRKKYKVQDGGVREAPFWVLVGAQDMPAILLEMGYITHPEEGKRIANATFQETLAKGIADGIDNYFYYNP